MLTAFLDGKVFAETYGSGPPSVVALHGWGRGRQDWSGVLGGLSAWALDLPGFGLSPAPPSAWGAADYAEFLWPALDRSESLVLVGHSFGGRVAIEIARRATNLKGLVLTGVPIFRTVAPGKPPLAYRYLKRLREAGVLSESRLETARKRYGSRDYAMAEGVMRDILVRVVHEEYRTELEEVSAPVALVWGQEDKEVPLIVAEESCARLAQCRLITVKGSGHLLDPQMSRALRMEIGRMLEGWQ